MKSLLKEKRYEEIHISEICDMVGINRSTFYDHYQSLDGLLISLEEEVEQKIKDIFGDFSSCSRDSFLSMFRFMDEDHNLYLAYFAGHFDSFLPRDVFLGGIVGNKTLAMKMECSENDMLLRQSFFYGGLLSLAKAWFLSDTGRSVGWMADTAYRYYLKIIG